MCFNEKHFIENQFDFMRSISIFAISHTLSTASCFILLFVFEASELVVYNFAQFVRSERAACLFLLSAKCLSG